MSRLLMLAAIVALVYLLIKSWRRNAVQQNKAVTEDMVRCAHCGVHLPRSESIQSQDKLFCSTKHRDAYLK